MVVVQDMGIEHRQLLAALVGNPLGPVRDGVLDLGLGLLQTPGFPTHQAAETLAVVGGRHDMAVRLVRVVEREDLELGVRPPLPCLGWPISRSSIGWTDAC
mgnify:CR=1 FL=1